MEGGTDSTGPAVITKECTSRELRLIDVSGGAIKLNANDAQNTPPTHYVCMRMTLSPRGLGRDALGRFLSLGGEPPGALPFLGMVSAAQPGE